MQTLYTYALLFLEDKAIHITKLRIRDNDHDLVKEYIVIYVINML